MDRYETLQKQIKWADAIGMSIFSKSKVEKVIKRAMKSGVIDYVENNSFPLGYIFNYYGKKECTFCVVNEELKETLINIGLTI